MEDILKVIALDLDTCERCGNLISKIEELYLDFYSPKPLCDLCMNRHWDQMFGKYANSPEKLIKEQD